MSSATTWNVAGNGNWSTSADWSPATFPNSSSTNACITNGTSTVTLDTNASLASLQLASGNTLTTNLNTQLSIFGPQIVNAGQIRLNGGGGTNSLLILDGSTTLSGAGALTLSTAGGGGAAYIQQGVGGVTLTNQSTIQGNGVLQSGLALSNSGTLDANSSGATLLVQNTGGITNTGVLEATGSGILQLNGVHVNNAGGNITANGGTVQLLGGTVIQGGTFNQSGGGTQGTPNGATATLDGSSGAGAVTINGTYTADRNSQTTLLGTVSNQGTIQLNGGSGANGIVLFGSASAPTPTLQGGGTLNLTTTTGGGSAYLQQAAGGVTLTNVNNTISGEGVIGNNGLSLVNQGTIDANSSGASGLTTALVLDSMTSFRNSGLLEATNHGVLQLNGVTVNDAGGHITANGASAVVQLFGGTVIQGGTLTNSGGVLGTPSGSTAALDGSTAAGAVTLNGTYLSDFNSQTTLVGTISNNNLLQLNGGSGTNGLILAGKSTTPSVTLQGGGTLNLTTTTGGGSAVLEQAVGGVTLTNVNNTISGEGVIGNNGLSLVNEATIDANSSGASGLITALVLDSMVSFRNSGLLEATNSGVLQFNGVTVNNSGGQITAVGASAVVQLFGGAVIQGGTLSNSGGTLGTAAGGVATLDGTTHGAVSVNGTYLGASNSQTHLSGTITNNGTLQVNGGGGVNSLLLTDNNVTLQGGGTVTLVTAGGGGAAFIEQSAGGLTLTNVNNTIQGAGIIGNNGLTLVNQAAGTVDASVAATALALSGGAVTNQGLLEATGAGVLQINGDTVNNAGGKISAGGAGAVVQLFGNAVIQGGTLTNSGGTLGTAASAVATLDGTTHGAVTINGTYLGASNSQTHLSGTITNNGNLQVNGGGGVNSFLLTDNNVTLQGGGTVTLVTAGGGGAAFIEQSAGGLTLTNASNAIQGAGIIGNNGLSVTNGSGGTIVANVSGATLSLTSSGTLTNQGTLEATGGGRMLVTMPLANFSGNTLTGGTYIVNGTSAPSALGLSLGSNTGGEIVNNAANIVLNGPNANVSFIDANGHAALALAANTTANSSLTIQGGYALATPGAFANAGVVLADTGSTITSPASYTQTGGTTTVNGRLAAASVAINGGTLAGGTTATPGTISAPVTIGAGGTLIAGSANGTPGTLDFASILRINGTLGLNATSGTSFGVVNVAGTGAGAFTIGGGSTLNLTNLDALNLAVGTTLTIGTSGSLVAGTFTNILGQTYDGGARTWDVLYNHGGDNIELTSASTTPVGNPAQASAATPNPIAFGNFRVGATAPSQALSIGNIATAPADGLNASIATSTTGLTAGGSFKSLAPGSTNNTSLVVGMSTATAGPRNGTATITLASDGATTGCTTSCGLPSQTINVTGGVYEVAQPTFSSTTANLGNFHVGTAPSTTITIGNPYASGVPSGYQEGLNATAGATTGTATISGGPIANLAAGGSSNAISVGLTGVTAGAESGTATVTLASNGTGTSGLTTLSLGNQIINVSGTGYNLAVGSASPSPVTIANQRVGGSSSQALTVANTAPAGSFTEVLNASFGANSGAATNNGGSISGGSGAGGVAGGGSNNTAMSVGVNTATAGARTGTVTVSYVSNGTGTSGLGNTSVGSQTITVSGKVYQEAAGQILTSPLNFGTVQVGQSVSQTLSIRNTASGPAGFVEDLGANFGATSGTGASLISGSGTITGLTAGSTDSSHMTVSVNTSAAATVSGAIAVSFLTEGTVGGVSNGLGVASVGSASYGVSGAIQTQGQVINDASPVVNNSPINLGAVRVGGTSPVGFVSLTNQATTAPQAALDATIAGTAPITASGSVSLLAPGNTDTTHLQVGMSTATAGHISGTATLALVSDANNVGGCGSNCLLTLPSQNVTVTGNVYQPAAAKLNTTTPLFGGVGIVHVGDTVTQALSVTNTASGALNDSLLAQASGASAGYTASGNLGSAGLAAGVTDTSSLKVSINTSSAAVLSAGTATFSLASHDGQLSDLALAPLAVSVAGVQVNNYANPLFALDSGAGSLSHTGTQYVLDLGNLTQGASATTDLLSLLNQTSGPADLLKGSYTIVSTPAGLTLEGFDPFSGLGAGQGQSGLDVTFDPMTLGAFSGAVQLVATGYNASGYTQPFDLTLTVEGDVLKKTGVPEPDALALALCGGALLWLFRVRRPGRSGLRARRIAAAA